MPQRYFFHGLHEMFGDQWPAQQAASRMSYVLKRLCPLGTLQLKRIPASMLIYLSKGIHLPL